MTLSPTARDALAPAAFEGEPELQVEEALARLRQLLAVMRRLSGAPASGGAIPGAQDAARAA